MADLRGRIALLGRLVYPLAPDEALTKLAAEEPDKANLVKLRYFGGLSLEEAADAMGISRTTASRHWTYARVWLYSELTDDSD